MRRKKICFVGISGRSNVQSLVKYYKKHLAEKYNSYFKICLFERHWGKKKSLKRFLKKAMAQMHRFHKFDLLIEDYFTVRSTKITKYLMCIFHGAAMKQRPGNDEKKNPATMKKLIMMREHVDYVITQAHHDEKIYLRSEELDKHREIAYFPFGIPRNDQLFDTMYVDEIANKMRKKYALGDKKILLYAPTFRNYSVGKYSAFSEQALQKLDQWLKVHNWCCLYRPHPNESILPLRLLDTCSHIQLFSGNEEPDTQQCLMLADALVTDYSSLFIDYLILDRPIGFYVFDFPYFRSYRGINMDLNKNFQVPGEVLSDLSGFSNFLATIDKNPHYGKEKRTEAQEYYYAYFDGKCCERIWDFIIQKHFCIK